MMREAVTAPEPPGPHFSPWFRAGLPNGSVVVVGASMPSWIERLPMTGPDDRVVHVPSMTQVIPVENQSARTVILNTEIEKNTAVATEIARVLGPGGLVFTSGGLCGSTVSALCHDLNREGIIACANLPGVPAAQNGVRSIAVRPLSHDARLLDRKEQRMLEDLQSTGSLTFRALGGSMRPIIPDGNWVRIEAISSDRELSVGRMVYILQPDRCVLHPIKRKLQTGLGPAFLCQGLRVKQPDLPVFRDAVVGILAETWTNKVASRQK